MRRGFSVLEVLAASVILGLLATAIIPMTRRLVSDHHHLAEQQAARTWLLQAGSKLLRQLDPNREVIPIETNPSWFLHVTILSAQVPPPRPGVPLVHPNYRWAVLSVRSGANDNDTLLAERYVLLSGGE